MVISTALVATLVVVGITVVAARAELVKSLSGKAGGATAGGATALSTVARAVLVVGLLVTGTAGVGLAGAAIAVELGGRVVSDGDSEGGEGGLDDVEGVQHAEEGVDAERTTLVGAGGVGLVLTALGGTIDEGLELVGSDGVGPQDNEGDWNHFEAAEQRGDTIVQISVREGIGLLQDVGALQDPEEDLLEESQTDDKLDGNKLGYGFEVGHVRLELDSNEDDSTDSHTVGEGSDDAEPKLGEVGLALVLAIDASDLGNDGGDGDAKSDDRVLEDHKGALLKYRVSNDRVR